MMENWVTTTKLFLGHKKNVKTKKKVGLQYKPNECETDFLGNIAVKEQSTILASFQKFRLGVKTPTKEEK